MSLEYWFPLTSDLHNQGIASLANASVQSGCSLSSDGKLGGCYKNTGTTVNVATPISFSADQFTMCAWVRIDARTNGWHRAIGMSGSGTYMGMVCENTNGKSVGFHYYKTIDGTNTSIFDNYPCSPTVDTWYHYAMCYDGTRYYVYLNGDKITDAVANKPNIRAEMTTLWLFGGTRNNYVNDSINDVRIYSHCLSPLEIAEIAKGMVLHYPMTGGGRSGDNLVVGTQRNQYSNDLTLDNDRKSGMLSAGSGGNGVFSITEEDVPVGIYSYNVTNNTSGNRDYQQGGIPFISGKQYTASWWAKGNGSCLFRSWNRTRGAEVVRDTWTLTSNWKYYTRTFTATQAMQDDCCTFHLGVTGNASIKIAGMKLEEGSHATPWMPNSADTAYTTMGYNTNTEYDTSGYLHNGTINGSVSYSSDTARYSVSTSFVNGSYISTTIPVPSGDGSIYTFAWWGKITSISGTMMWGFANGNRLNLYIVSGNSNCYWNIGDGSNNPFGVNPSTFGDGTWHHFAITGDGTTTKLYIDGEFKANAKTFRAITGTTLIFNGWDTSNSYNFNGNLSDFRLYATALSAEDIQKLYNTSASIANNGVLMSYEFAET